VDLDQLHRSKGTPELGVYASSRFFASL
jgi:hypothetical protein